MALLSVANYPNTSEFLAAVNSQFDKGATVVQAVRDHEIVATMFPPSVSKEVLALRAARKWVADPSVFKELIKRLDEEPKEWE
jgi:hypothetical protein